MKITAALLVTLLGATPSIDATRQVAQTRQQDAGKQFLALIERLTESCRRTLFYARVAVTKHGGARLEPEHLLLGILEEIEPRLAPLVPQDRTVAQMREDLIRLLPPGPTLAENAEIPFSRGARRALQLARTEADSMGAADIRSEHLLLALLRDPTDRRSQIVHDAGITREVILKLLTQPEPTSQFQQ
jgi:ATP-dependent Clp protease ATP-binding subunit ClpA